MDRVTSFVKMFRDRETRQVLLCALKVLTKTFDGLTGLIVPVAEYFNKAGHSIHVALVLGIMLCGKNVGTEAPGDSPYFSACHQSSARLKL